MIAFWTEWSRVRISVKAGVLNFISPPICNWYLIFFVVLAIETDDHYVICSIECKVWKGFFILLFYVHHTHVKSCVSNSTNLSLEPSLARGFYTTQPPWPFVSSILSPIFQHKRVLYFKQEQYNDYNKLKKTKI